MAKIVQRRRGTTTDHNNFPGAAGEITVDLTDKTVRVHDGDNTPFAEGQPTGYPLARADMSNVSGTPTGGGVGVAQLNLNDGAAGQVLQTNGSGVLSFVEISDVSSATIGGDLSGTVGNAQIIVGAVGNNELASLSVTNDKIADGTIQQAKLSNISIGSAQLQTNSVITSKILNANVTESKLSTNSISTIKIIDLNVTTDKLANLSVTAAKLAADSVTTIKIVDANVTNDKIFSMAASKLTGPLPVIDGSSLTGLPYDISFIGGFNTATLPINVVAQIYGEMVTSRIGVFDGEFGVIETAPAGSTLICDVEINGTSIYSVKPTFAAGSTVMTAGTLSTTSFTAGQKLTFRVTQIGSGTAGAGLRFMLNCRV